MNPYLEEPAIWPGVHVNLAVAIQEALVPQLPAHYYVTVELRVYEAPQGEVGPLVGIGDVTVGAERRRPNPTNPTNGAARYGEREAAANRTGVGVLTVEVPRSVEVREHYLEVRRAGTHEVITVVEILSPTNKRPGKGRQIYEQKRTETVSALTNLVEIDLLRSGEPLPVLHHGLPLERAEAGDFRVLVSRGYRRHQAELYVWGLRAPLPVVPVPLRHDEPEPTVDLQALLHTVYDRGGYSRIVDYRGEPVPPLSADDAAWADGVLRSRGIRRD
jgi:hypothetical protein